MRWSAPPRSPSCHSDPVKQLLGLLLIAAQACARISTSAVLEPLRPVVEQWIAVQRTPPQYFLLSDSVTASVLGPLARRLGAEIIEPPTVPICPWDSAIGPHGYAVRLSLDTLSRNDALARIELRCGSPRPRRPFAEGAVVKLQRRRGQWKILGFEDHWMT